jgi:hypothetical protein
LHEYLAKLGPPLVLQVNELVNVDALVPLGFQGLLHGFESFILLVSTLSVRDEVKDGGLNSLGELGKGVRESLSGGVQLQELGGGVSQQGQQLLGVLVEVTDLLGEDGRGKVVRGILADLKHALLAVILGALYIEDV